MNPLKKGPELKMPELKKPDLKVPGRLADFYYDLRDRRLLPVLALVVVAIVATPILLGNKSEPVALPPAASAVLESAPGSTSKLTVVEATPGLREYRKRLKARSPSDPFVPQYTGAPGGGSASASGGSAEGGSSPSSTTFSETTESTTIEVETGGGGGSGGAGGNSGGGSGGGAPNPQNGVRLFEFVFDVQISHAEPTPDGAQKMSAPLVRKQVKTLTQLPGKKTPVVTIGGYNLHNGKVFLLVSDEVRSLDGEFTCATRPPSGLCELVELEPGFPLELTYGPEKVAYRIKITDVGTVWTGKAGDKGSQASSSRSRFSGPVLGALPGHSFSK
jgi:hypothetical protein